MVFVHEYCRKQKTRCKLLTDGGKVGLSVVGDFVGNLVGFFVGESCMVGMKLRQYNDLHIMM